MFSTASVTVRSIGRHFSQHSSEFSYDLVVLGGGIVGLATAREVALRHPAMKIALVEKERKLASHQTGHNSGVIHTGIYYTPGSLKAKLCVKGAEMMYDYCDKHNVPHKTCGKVIVAKNEEEVPRLKALYARGMENGVKGLRLIGPEELGKLEPHCTGKMAVHSPRTGIVDFSQVAHSYAEDFRETGGNVLTSYEVNGFITHSGGSQDSTITIHAKDKPTLRAKHVIACCGLHADRVAQLSGCSPEPKIVPFRGDYLILKPEKNHLVNGNIYPVPDPQFPFLGVHFTPRMDGSVWLGPSAVLAFAREGYKLTDFNLRDLLDSTSFRGMRKLMMKHWQVGASEIYREVVMAAQVKCLRKFVPALQVSDVERGPSGVRAQALDRDGTLVDDFVFDHNCNTTDTNTNTHHTDRSGGSGSGRGRHLPAGMLHVRNAPSPAATSSLAIAEMVADKAEQLFQWTPVD